MKTKITIVFFSLLLAQSIVFAQTEQTTAPTQTTPPIQTAAAEALAEPSRNVPAEFSSDGFTFQNGQLILGTQNSSLNPPLYIFHNHSDYQQLLLSHPTNTAMSAGWESRLDQGQWSALAMNQPNFVINCFGRKPGAIGYVDCKSVLEVYSYPKANVGGGNYWVSENKSLSGTISSLKIDTMISK